MRVRHFQFVLNYCSCTADSDPFPRLFVTFVRCTSQHTNPNIVGRRISMSFSFFAYFSLFSASSMRCSVQLKRLRKCAHMQRREPKCVFIGFGIVQRRLQEKLHALHSPSDFTTFSLILACNLGSTENAQEIKSILGARLLTWNARCHKSWNFAVGGDTDERNENNLSEGKMLHVACLSNSSLSAAF